MIKTKVFLLVSLICSIVSAQEYPHWLRYPAISPDGMTIAFTYKGDLYTVPSSGGEARPLTFHEAQDYMPVWSRDGKKIAFASDRFGNFDVYVVDVMGGEATRLTCHSNPEVPYAFSADDRFVIFGGQRMDAAEHRQYPTASQPEAYKVPAAGGRIDQLWTFPAEDINVSQSGQKMVYHDKKGGENPWRKHHTSSIARDIWLFDSVSGKHTMITQFNGEDRNPVFAESDNSIYYLSEESGNFNVHMLSLDNPGTNRQVTSFEKNPVRFLTISATGTLCFSYDGDLYTLNQGGQPGKVSLFVRTESKSNNEKVIPVSGNVSEMSVSPNGKEVAFVARGEVFVSSVEGGVTKRITNTPGQERFVSFAPDGKALLYASERDTTWGIYQTKVVRSEEPYFYASTELKEETLICNVNDNYQPKFSPDGKEIGFIENRRSLRVYNIAEKKMRTLLTSDDLLYMREGDQYFSWSPDGKWILAEYRPVLANREVILMKADGTGKKINMTQSGYGDSNPKWVNDGKQLLWFSDRDGLRSYANSGSRQEDVYTLFLTRDSWDRFNLSKEDFALLKEIEEKEKKKKEASEKEDEKGKKKPEVKKDTTIVIDWDDLEYRKARLTIHSSLLGDAVLSKDGEKLYYLARFEKGLNLWSTELRTKETKMEIELNARSGSLEWDKEMKNLFLLADGRISKINAESKKRETIGIDGEAYLDITAERRIMFDHVWKRTKAMFYISTFHGADWEGLRTIYEAKLPYIGNDFEFTELLSEMLGELNASHCGASYRYSDPNGDRTASLGIFIDYSYNGDGLKIAEVIKGGPMDKDNIDVTKGMIIEKIDGERITSDVDASKFLNRKEDKFTSLQLFDPVKNSRKQVTVKPVSQGNENSLLYKRWVRMNEEEVDRLSNGQLGYVHIPGMSDGPYRNTYEEVMGKYHDRKGVIADTRFNGGGDLVSDLAMFFSGEKFLEYAIEGRPVGYEPAFRYTRPIIAMVNESNYSDGSCFACGFQELGIGKLVGMPVPGTCSWAGWEMLQNGTVRWGSIPVSTKNMKGEWLENIETVPEIKVKNEPDIISKGRDQQLEKAVEELLKEVR